MCFSDKRAFCGSLYLCGKLKEKEKMRKTIASMLLCLSATLSAQVETVVTDHIRFCESTYPYQDGLLIASFGTQELNPLNTEGKGYVVFYKDGKTQVLVPADGNLSAPKGMFVRRDYLYVCDVNKVVVYHLTDRNEPPQVITLPEGNLFVNDLAADGNNLYVSVTNTDKIFRMDITDPAHPGEPQEWLNIAGPNGLLIRDGVMYVASYPADGVTKAENVIYEVTNLELPVVRQLTETAGQYDGIAFDTDGRSLIVTNWAPAQLSRLSLADGTLTPLEIELPQGLVGPADITVRDGRIYIPDLPNSRVVVWRDASR